jgi:divalent metal cation (Fe/Co/Zn/Cd) transporter
LLVRSVETLLTGDPGVVISFPVIVVFVLTVVLKFIAWAYCRTVTTSASASALATDHRNDVLSNLFGVSTALISTMYWFADPLGAIVMGLYIMAVWATTAYDQLHVITGKTAPNEVLAQLTYLAMHHHPAIIGVDTVRAYYFGYNYQVELDIILPEEMSLREAHDIGESLQNRLEDLPVVERAFVHVDWEGEHAPEHANAGTL